MSNVDPKLELIWDFETHDLSGIEEKLKKGIDPNESYKDKPLVEYLIHMYTRGPKFKMCLQLLLDHGLVHSDKLMQAILLDDEVTLAKLLDKDPSVINKSYNLECAYTALIDVSLLHICAEYNHKKCARILVDYGANVNAMAGIDKNGFGGQTPIFHTVNQNQNASFDMLLFLLENGADLDINLKGVYWGRGFPWESLIPEINPISYAMMGRLPQFHRDEQTTSEIVELLLNHKYKQNHSLPNIPNRYLAGEKT